MSPAIKSSGSFSGLPSCSSTVKESSILNNLKEPFSCNCTEVNIYFDRVVTAVMSSRHNIFFSLLWQRKKDMVVDFCLGT